MGIIKGFFMAAAFRAAWSHLPSKKGLATGIASSGAGVGAAIFGLFFQMLADPDDVKPIKDPLDQEFYFPKEVGSRFPHIQQDVIILYVCILVFSLALINNRELTNEEMYLSQGSELSRSTKDIMKLEDSISLKVLIFSPHFIKILIMTVLSYIYLYFFIEAYKELGEDIIDDETLTLTGSIGGIMISVNRIMGGFLLDIIEFKYIYSVASILILVQIVTMPWAL